MNLSDIRYSARRALSGMWGISILVGFLASLLGAGMYGGTSSLGFRSSDLKDLFQFISIRSSELQNLNNRTYLSVLLALGSAANFLGIVQFIIGGTVKLGYCRFLLKQHDGDHPELSDLFSQFDRFGDGFCLAFLQTILIALWSLLFVIPGIVASYKYAMAQFIMVENPNMRASEALQASKTMMYGHKMELFILHLSFFGWMILCSLTFGIGNLWLNPYMNAANAAFYREISSGSGSFGHTVIWDS